MILVLPLSTDSVMYDSLYSSVTITMTLEVLCIEYHRVTQLWLPTFLAKIVISYQGRKTMSFFGTSPRAPARGRVLKNSRFEPAVRILLFAAESKKQVRKGLFLRSIIASKTSVFETPWRKTNMTPFN